LSHRRRDDGPHDDDGPLDGDRVHQGRRKRPGSVFEESIDSGCPRATDAVGSISRLACSSSGPAHQEVDGLLDDIAGLGLKVAER
jgi:hypothetical protein